MPVWQLSDDPKKGSLYDIDLPREWLVKAAPFLKVLSSTLGLMLPVVAAQRAKWRSLKSTTKASKPNWPWKGERGSTAEGWREMGEWLANDDELELARSRRFAPTAAISDNSTLG